MEIFEELFLVINAFLAVSDRWVGAATCLTVLNRREFGWEAVDRDSERRDEIKSNSQGFVRRRVLEDLMLGIGK
jgi:hypothetical protein